MSEPAPERAGEPVPPGEVLREQFLEPCGLAPETLAQRLGVPASRLEGILQGERRLCADTALRLARYFGTAPELWLQLQEQYELDVAFAAVGDALERIEPHATREGSRG